MAVAAFAIAISLASAPAAASSIYDDLISTAGAAFERQAWSEAARALDEAQSLRPYSLYVAKNRILAYALAGERLRAVGLAQTLADRGLSISFTGHPALTALAEEASLAPIIARMAANNEPVGQAETAFEIAQSDLLPESLLVRGRSRALLGSVRTGRIVSGRGEEFATAPGGVYGLAEKPGVIWVVANARPPFAGAAVGPSAAFYAFDQKTGQKICEVQSLDENSILGAIEATPAWLVASDSDTPRLLRLDGCHKAPSVLSQDARFVNLQGVAYDKRRKRLYVADYLAGIFAVELRSGEATPLKNSADAHLGGIDGLYVYKGDLVGIQNGTQPQRIVRLKLDKIGLDVTGLLVLQQALAEWREPTNGQIVGDELYYVATSNWPAYDENGALRPDVERAPVRIMVAPLR